MSLIDVARAAYNEREQAREAEEADRAERRRLREVAEDDEALILALQSPISEWFPGVAWELVDRGLPQRQVVLRDPESGLHFKVHPTKEDGSEWGVDLVSPNPRGQFGGKYDVHVSWAKSPADIGRWLADQERSANARAVDAEATIAGLAEQ